MSSGKIIEDIGNTSRTAPEGAEPWRVWITTKRSEPIEAVSGCTDFRLTPDEAVELGDLLVKAGLALGGKRHEAQP